MCICCKKRDLKDKLYRFKVENMLLSDSIYGKSMYICYDCLCKDDKVLQKNFSKILKTNLDKLTLIYELKEKFLYVRKD